MNKRRASGSSLECVTERLREGSGFGRPCWRLAVAELAVQIS